MLLAVKEQVQELLNKRLPDPDLRALVENAIGAVQMALDKAAANAADPTRYPLPASPESLERKLFARLQHLRPAARSKFSDQAQPRLEAAPVTRRTIYGLAGSLDARTPQPILERTVSLPLDPALQQTVARARVRLKAAAASAAITEPSPGSQSQSLVPRGIELVLRSIKCIDKTDLEVGRDEISLAAISHDFLARRETTLDPVSLGQFRQGDEKTFTPPLRMHAFTLLDDALFDQFFQSTLFLAEIDFGGFPDYVHESGALSDHELHEIAFAGAVVLVGAWLGEAAGMAGGLVLAGALGTGPVVAAAMGLMGATVGLVAGTLLGLLAAAVLVMFADVITGLFGDEIFPPVVVGQTTTAVGHLPGTTALQRGETVTFRRPHASYEVQIEWRIQLGQPSGTTAPPPSSRPPTEAPDRRTADANLDKIEHIVVLMLENRSFDHLLGYLKLAGHPVDGITSDMTNALHDAAGQPGQIFPVTPFPDTEFLDDPGHNFCNVRRQLGIRDPQCPDALAPNPAPQNVGFVDDFFITRDRLHPGRIMGFHTADQVPAVDLIANEFAVCDRWFSAFPGNTWVNRGIALTGRAARDRNGKPILDNRFPFDEVSFFRTLDAHGVDWRFYSQDVPTLLLVDHDYVSQPTRFRGMDEFLEDAQRGTLPPVSWLDPNFVDFGPIQDIENHGFNAFPNTANDDHPPTDIAHGQVLVSTLFFTLFDSPLWEKLLFLIVYDEHGGFFDHVPPPLLPENAREDEHFTFLGLRVPALVISPWVGRGLVSHRQFDHTSIIRTIIQRFCRSTAGVPAISPRVQAAEHLGWLLNEPAPRFMPRSIPVVTGAEDARLLTRPVPWLIGERHTLAARLGPLVTRALARPVRPQPPTELQLQILDGREQLARLGFHRGLPLPPLLRM